MNIKQMAETPRESHSHELFALSQSFLFLFFFPIGVLFLIVRVPLIQCTLESAAISGFSEICFQK